MQVIRWIALLIAYILFAAAMPLHTPATNRSTIALGHVPTRGIPHAQSVGLLKRDNNFLWQFLTQGLFAKFSSGNVSNR